MSTKPETTFCTALNKRVPSTVYRMKTEQPTKASGSTFLGPGVAFMGIAASGQSAFWGVGMTFLTLGIVFLAKARKDKQP